MGGGTVILMMFNCFPLLMPCLFIFFMALAVWVIAWSWLLVCGSSFVRRDPGGRFVLVDWSAIKTRPDPMPHYDAVVRRRLVLLLHPHLPPLLRHRRLLLLRTTGGLIVKYSPVAFSCSVPSYWPSVSPLKPGHATSTGLIVGRFSSKSFIIIICFRLIAIIYLCKWLDSIKSLHCLTTAITKINADVWFRPVSRNELYHHHFLWFCSIWVF